LERARGKATFRQVEEILFPHVTKSSIVRLEHLQEVPTDRKIRARAAMVLLLYGYDLEDFGLSDEDVPPAIDLEVLQRLRPVSNRGCDLHLPDNNDYGDNHSYRQLAAA
jgi:hypothetical protein